MIDTDASMTAEPRAARVLDLIEAHHGNADFELARKKAEFRRMREAALLIRARRPELLSQGENPTLDIDAMPKEKRGAYRYWWGEGTLSQIARAEKAHEKSIMEEVRKLEQETGVDYRQGLRRGRRAEHNKVEKDF